MLTGQEPQPGEAEHLLRGWHGEGAVEHLFVVAAGLDSAQVGEREIQGQLRDALETARAVGAAGGAAGGLLGRLVEEALRVAHQVHRNSALGEGRLSLAEIAADHLLERVRRSPGRVALIGVSPMTRKCGEALARENVPLVVVNRTLEHAEELAGELGNAVAMSLDDFRARPPRVEALVAATGSPEAVLDRACLERLAARSESGEPLLAVDLAVPPDVDPAAARAVGIQRLGMDEVNREADAQRSRRQAETAAARELVDAALDELRHRLAERVLSPVLARIHQRYRQTAAEGIERLLAKEGAGFDERQREALGRWAETLAKRLAHLPTVGLRGLASELGVEAVGSFLAAGDAELFREFNDIAGALDPLAGNPEMREMPQTPDGDPSMTETLSSRRRAPPLPLPAPESSTDSAGPRSRDLFERAKAVIPGGVNSPVRAYRAVGGTPLFLARGEGAHFEDADGRRYLDFVGSWGPLILGHAHPEVLAAVTAAAARGMTFGAPCAGEIDLAEAVVARYPGLEQVRFVSSGTEATMSAIRLARGATGRDLIVKFAGCYHGHADHLLVAAGSGLVTFGRPSSAGVPAPFAALDPRPAARRRGGARRALRRRGRAHRGGDRRAGAGQQRPAAAAHRVSAPPARGDRAHRHSAHLRRGDQRLPRGARRRRGALRDHPRPRHLRQDPRRRHAGRRVRRAARSACEHLAPEGDVYQAGTLSGNPVAMAAGLATLAILEREQAWTRLDELGEYLQGTLAPVLAAAPFPVAAGAPGLALLDEPPGRRAAAPRRCHRPRRPRRSTRRSSTACWRAASPSRRRPTRSASCRWRIAPRTSTAWRRRSARSSPERG